MLVLDEGTKVSICLVVCLIGAVMIYMSANIMNHDPNHEKKALSSTLCLGGWALFIVSIVSSLLSK